MTARDRMARAEAYVFGLMSEHERERAQRDMEVDAQFRQCVTMFGEQLRRLRDEPKVPLSIPDDAWKDISLRIADMPHLTGAETAARMAGMLPPATDPSRKGLLRVRRPYAHQFGGWKGTVVAGALAAALVIGYLSGQTMAPPPSPQAAAVLVTGDGTAGAVVEEFSGNRLRILPLIPLDVPAGKVLQVWAGEIPVGVLGRVGDVTLQGPDLAAPQEGHFYEITLEDAPGSPTGRRQGALLLSGQAVVPPR